MKRLMSLFAAITLVTSTAAPVVACTKDRYSTPTLSDELKNLLEAQFNQDVKDGSIDSTYNFGDIFKTNLSNMTTLATRLINQVISRYFTNTESVTRQKNAGVSSPATPDPTTSNTPFKNQITTLAKDQLYSDYVKYYEANNQLEDIDMVNKGYTLLNNDPINSTTTVSKRNQDVDEGNANPLIEGYYYSQQKTPKPNSTDPADWDYINQTESKQASQSEATSNSDIEAFLFGTKNPNWNINNVKDTLWKCYQDYYIHVELTKIIDNAITSTYLDNNYLQADQNKDSYLNYRSDLLSSMQNWPVSQSSAAMQSNFKMAWKFQFSKNIIPAGTGKGTLGSINDLIGKAMNGKPDDVKGRDGNPQGLLTPQYWTPTNFNTAIKDIFGSGTQGAGILDQATKLGTDPIFGDKSTNFDGFAAYGSDGKIIGSDYTPDSSFSTALQKNANKVGFLSNGGGGYQIADKKATNDYDFVFTLPIYAQDLLNNETYSYQDKNQTKRIWPINLRGYVGGTLPEKGSANFDNLKWNNLNIQGGYNQYQVKYLHDMGLGASASTTASFGNYSIDGSKKNTDSSVNKEKLDLFNYAKYYFGQGADLATAAKTNYYSQAFDYDPKNLYDSNLYDQIGKYIIDHTDD